MSETTIRPLQGSDLDPVIAIWNRALSRDPTNERRFVQSIFCYPDYLSGDDPGFFVATENDRPIGFLRTIVRRWPSDRVGVEPDDGWIPVVAVDPDHQRRGVGSDLLDTALDFFRTHGRKRIWVCGKTGSAAGYVYCGVDKDAYPGDLRLVEKAGFTVKNEPVAISREITTFDAAGGLEYCEQHAEPLSNIVRKALFARRKITPSFRKETRRLCRKP